MSNLRLFYEALTNYQNILIDPEEISHFERHQLEIISNEIRQTSIMDYRREVNLLSSMAVYGTWNGLIGTVKLANSDTTGWKHLSLCFLYRAWKIRTEIASGDRVRKTKGRLLRDGLAEALGHSIVLGDYSFSKWCGDRVLRSFKTKEGAFTNEPYGTPFEPFLFQLYGIWQGETVDFSRFRGCKLGPYNDVVKHWTSQSESFSSALRIACDYHCDTEGFGEYGNVPYVHIPVEILATLKIRELLGLGTPTFSHPILETPFAKVPELLEMPDDPLLVGAIKKIREAHPEIGYPW